MTSNLFQAGVRQKGKNMVADKNVDEEKKSIQIKAKKGAWWNSTVATEVVAEEAIETPAKKKQTRPRRPAKKASSPKKVPNKPEQASSENVLESEHPSEAGKQRRSRSSSKKPASKRPAKTPKEVRSGAKTKAPDQDDAVSPDEKELSTPDLPEDVSEESTDVQAKKKTKPGRGRRGKKPASKKIQIEDSEQQLADASTELKADEESPNLTEEAGQQSKDSATVEKPEEDKAPVAENKDEVKKQCKLLINAEEPEECRLALLEDGRLESIHVSTVSRTQTKNNIYKARIVAIEPSLQAAFVDYGTDKNGFLPFSEIHPEYYKQQLSDATRHLVETHQWKKLSITDVVEKGQEILAQVVKEEVGKKGANMTTYLSIPGRCVVLMPGSDSAGISRKISGEQRRSQLRETMKSMDLPEGIGWIVRTASVDITQSALARDSEFLLELWEDIKKKGQTLEGVGLVYEDQKSVLRFLREHFDPSIEEILVDAKDALDEVKAFIKMLPNEQRSVKVRLHQGARPIFNQYSVEDQIESIYQPQVNLPSGGSIVIDPTEALVAIDVNSGSTSKGKNFEASIFQANMEAAAELARQLRLRDLGGLIVVDFIDMRSRKNIMAVEKQVKAAMKKDKAKVDFSRISKFGLMQISRQKLGAPIEAGNYHRCEHCKGRGVVRSIETQSLYYLRRIQTGASRKPVERIECHLPLDIASYLLNNKRGELSDMEKRYQVEITIIAETDMKPADNELIFHKAEKEDISKKQA
ncbi:MAG: Rne/Rng family ribonuclease [Desulforhopalus sp.]